MYVVSLGQLKTALHWFITVAGYAACAPPFDGSTWMDLYKG
jgi:hypothetical protein